MKVRRIRAKIKSLLPWSVLRVYRLAIATLRHPTDISSVCRFLLHSSTRLSFGQRLSIVRRFYVISYAVTSPHTQEEMLRVLEAVLSLPEGVRGCVVEAGSFKGGSTAKLSIAAKLAGRELVVFDSFEGMPEHDEPYQQDTWGVEFREGFSLAKGTYCGTLDEVRANVRRFGHLEVCRFVKGWFDQTMPHFRESVAAGYLDVDLASSTRSCLRYLYPLLVPGGVLFSQDGNFPLVRDALDDDAFWTSEVGYPKPRMDGLGQRRLVAIPKPAASSPANQSLPLHAEQAAAR